MTNELNQQLEQVLAHLGDDKMSRNVRNMPITKGDKLTFTGATATVDTEIRQSNGTMQKVSYGIFKTVEGFDVPFSQIARRNNGLNITAATIGEAIKEFAARIPDDGLVVVVADVKKVESSFSDGKQTYYRFEVVE